MAITLQPFIRFTSFNFWLVGLDATFYHFIPTHIPLVTVALPPPLTSLMAQYKKRGVIWGPFPAFRGIFYGFLFFCFPGFTTSPFRFSAEFVSFFWLSATFFVLFRLSAIIYNAPSRKNGPCMRFCCKSIWLAVYCKSWRCIQIPVILYAICSAYPLGEFIILYI